MKTVALSSNTSWYLYNFRASSIRALRDRGYRVICLAPRDAYSERLVTELGCEWQPLDMDNAGSNPLRDLALLLRMLRYYRRYRPDIACHFTIKNNVYGTWAARLLGIPAINNIPGLGTSFTRRGAVSWVARQLYRLSQRFAHTIFCQNPQDLHELADSGLAPADRLHLVPGSGVDLQRFTPGAGERDTDRPFRFLYAGRMLKDKGLLELREAVTRLNLDGQACTLWLSGFSDAANASALTEAQLMEWSAEPWIEWLGPCDRMEQIYSQVQCVVLPSYREGTPRSLLEAAAMGLPVITTDVPGCRQVVVDGQSGFLCRTRDAASLTLAMSRMLHLAQEERRKMGLAGRKLVEARFDETLVVDATLAAIDNALSGSATTSYPDRDERADAAGS